MKKLSLLLCIFVFVLSMVACGSTESTESTDSTDAGGDDQVVTLKVAALESAYGTEMWQETVKAFEATVPNVKVELITDKSLEDVIGPSMKAGDFPDVIHCGVGRPAALTETFIKDNNMLDLSSVFEMNVPGESNKVKDKVADGFLDNSIIAPYGDGKAYLAPMFYSPCGLFYNEALFTEKGWTVPTTWDEMWALGDKAKEEGIALFTYPTAGYYDAFFFALLNGSGGPEFFNECMNYAEGIWETPEAQQAFSIVDKLAGYTHETVPANANNDNFRKNQQLILDNQALFMPNGNWVISEMQDAPRADGFKWGFTALPALSENGDRYSYTFFEQAWAPKAAENPEMAKEFIAFLYSDQAASIFAKYNAVQPVKGVVDTLEGDNKIYYGIYETGAKACVGSFAATDAVEGVNIAEDLFGTVNSLVSGDKTKDEWIEKVIESSEKLRKAKK